MNRTHTFDGLIEFDRSLNGPFVGSVLFHIAIITILSIGLPFMAPPPMTLSNPIPVELVEIDELTQVKEPKPVAEEKPKPEEEAPKAAPSAPKMDAEAPPDLTGEEQPEAEVIVPKEEKAPEPVKVKKPKSKPKPPVPEQNKKKNDFQSLLKNLTPDAATERQEETGEAETTTGSQIANISEQLTISEEDALRRQLSQCWNVMAGAKYAEDLVVEVRAVVNPDRTVQSATILDQGRYNRDSHYRAAADAALRALRNPRCTPLQLPEDKYEQWKVTTIRFDPRDML